MGDLRTNLTRSRRPGFYLLAGLMLALLGGLGDFGASAADGVPYGYQQGRSDVKYGTYGSAFERSAQGFQRALDSLGNQAYGLARLIDEDPVVQSEKVLELESEILRLHLEIADAPESQISEFTRKALLFGTVRVYEDVRHHGERLYENMIRFIDVQLPGPNGQQIRIESPSGYSLYRANYRSDRDLSPKEREAAYQKLLSEFLAKGGSLDECKKLTPSLLKSFKSYTRVEYVWLDNGDIIVTEGKAGHVLLAKGKDSRAAGQIVFLKNALGDFTLAVVSNASGNTKPDLVSARQFSEALRKKLKLPAELMILTKGEPVSSQGIKVYQKGQGVPNEVANARVKAAEKARDELLSGYQPRHRSSARLCGAVFSAI